MKLNRDIKDLRLFRGRMQGQTLNHELCQIYHQHLEENKRFTGVYYVNKIKDRGFLEYYRCANCSKTWDPMILILLNLRKLAGVRERPFEG